MKSNFECILKKNYSFTICTLFVSNVLCSFTSFTKFNLKQKKTMYLSINKKKTNKDII
jgi:hypothetical protein